MNTKIKLANFSLKLSALSFLGVIFGADMGAFIIFSVGCLIYSYLALYLFRRDGEEGSSKAFLGGFIAMTIFLVVHVAFLIISLISRDSDAWRWGWQFMITLFGIIPAVVIGIVIGGLIDLFSSKKLNFNIANNKKGNIFKTALICVIISMAIGLASVFPFTKYQTNYLNKELQVYNNKRQVEGLSPVTAGEQYLYSFNLKHNLINFSIKSIMLGVFIGLIFGIVKDKKFNK